MVFASFEKRRLYTLLGDDALGKTDNQRTASHLTILPWFSDLYFYAGVQTRTASLCNLRLLLYMLLGIIALVWFKLYAGPIVSAALIWFETFRLEKKSVQRAQLFEKDYTTFLLAFASAVRTGLDPLVALVKSARLFDQKSILRKEIEKVNDDLESGMREDQAVEKFASSVKHPDIRLLRTAIILSRKQGASLGECLQRLARVTRQRQSFRRKIKATLALQRLSAIGISVCALIIGLIQFLTNVEGVRFALSSSVGQAFLAAGAGLILTGLVWMLKISQDKV